MAEAVLSDGRTALGTLHQFPENAAEWCDRHEPDLAAGYRSGASELERLGEQLADLSEEHLSRTHAPASSPTRTRPGTVTRQPPAPHTGRRHTP